VGPIGPPPDCIWSQSHATDSRGPVLRQRPGERLARRLVREGRIEKLGQVAHGRVVVLGVGHALRADDAAGSIIAEELRARFPHRAFDGGQAPENFAGPVRRAEPGTIFLVDAANFGGKPGEVRVARSDEVVGLMTATHAPPLSVLMSLLSDETGAEVYLVAVQAATMELGGTMSAAVRDASAKLIEELSRLIEQGDSS